MAFDHRSRVVNPKLGNYFGIFTSAFVSLTLLVLVSEQLEVPQAYLCAAMLVFPILGYAAIGAFSYTQDPLDYFASGRRVPAFYSGLALALTAIGATGLVSATGVFFAAGFDGLCIVIGGLSGFVVMAILLAPFLRKFGAYTIPSYVGRRFQSRFLRLVVAVVVAVTMMLVMVAELQLAVAAASELSNLPRSVLALALALVVSLIVGIGGMRALSWSNVAQSIVGLLALLVPVAIVAVLLTNIPVPQLSHGPVLRELVRNEPALAVPIVEATWLQFNFANDGFEAIQKRFVDAFGNVGPIAFFMTIIIFLTGFAASPWLLPRVSATSGVYEARKSIGWATVIFGVAMLTLISIAVFVRHYIFEAVLVPQPDDVAPWLKPLIANGYAQLESSSSRVLATTLMMNRDSVLFSLPMAAQLPDVFWLLAVTGALALALAAISATGLGLANVLSEDVVHGLSWTPAETSTRLLSGRICVGLVISACVIVTLAAPADPLRLWMWSLSIVGATLFPLLVLSIWWKRISLAGAVVGTGVGFAVAVLAILAGEAGWFPLDGRIAGILGLPAAIAGLMGVSVLSRAPGRHELELVRDIRVPGGEILYDREMRKLRLRKRQQN